MAEIGDVITLQLLQGGGVTTVEFRLEITEAGNKQWVNDHPLEMKPGDQLYMRPLFEAMTDGDAICMKNGSDFATPVPTAAPHDPTYDFGGKGPIFPPADEDT